MITVFRNGELHYKNKVYRCALGKNGIIKEKKEGDGFTPSGIFSLGSLYYRPDRIKKINSFFKPIPIKSNMFWSDYPDSKYYNKLLYYEDTSCERLHRKDNTYDIILVINYNINPIIKNKGSAIFIHLAKKNFSPTAGCIALKKNCLLDILKYLKTTDKIKIVL
jgi:L,D-peptidoglycan transpeptidase YkuD (ErfK/YbiS/YcfS/YnhG family)